MLHLSLPPFPHCPVSVLTVLFLSFLSCFCPSCPVSALTFTCRSCLIIRRAIDMSTGSKLEAIDLACPLLSTHAGLSAPLLSKVTRCSSHFPAATPLVILLWPFFSAVRVCSSPRSHHRPLSLLHFSTPPFYAGPPRVFFNLAQVGSHCLLTLCDLSHSLFHVSPNQRNKIPVVPERSPFPFTLWLPAAPRYPCRPLPFNSETRMWLEAAVQNNPVSNCLVMNRMGP